MKKLPPRFHDDLPEMLGGEGFLPDAIEALLDIDGTIFLWQRAAAKGEVPAQLLAELGAEIECGQFYALTAIMRIQSGIGREPEPPTIGLMAQEMNIDPSRASRIASNLLDKGLVQREAAQDDGRKSVLVLTPKAQDLFRRYKTLKWQKLIDVFREWPVDDIESFARLLNRYVNGVRSVVHGHE